ncbi:MAG: S41 family peptidase [Bacterioplanes sp.]|nr:S41 family peptidase [Bacterioplanes sp.]
MNIMTWIASFVLATGLLAIPVSADETSQSSTPAVLPLNELRTFTEVFERIRSFYVEPVDDKTLLEYAIKGMLSELDPHSAYLEPEDFSDLQENTSGKFGGLGIEVGMEDGLIRVVSPIDDTPAQQAGILSGDLIISLDQEPVLGMSLNDAINRMRGEPGTSIDVEIRRSGEADILSFTLVRAEIKVASVRSERLRNDIGYVRITQFQERTGPDLVNILTSWQAETTPLKGLILDLRNNPGGVLDAAVDVTDAFISEGLIVYTEGRSEDAELYFEATEQTPAADYPVVVLINGGSASASEIVAGALQDHQRAVIVGTQSFGKGSVQSVLPITHDKAIKLTTARYFTPKGRSIQAQGITPDIWIEQSDVTPKKQRFYKEADLPGHLSNGREKDDTNDDSEQRASDELMRKDFQLYEAHTLLRGWALLAPQTRTPTSTQP